MLGSTHSLKLNSGYSIPVLGLGTWLSKPGEVADAVKTALTNGYQLLDCAQGYQNQKEIGSALKELFDGGVVKVLYLSSLLTSQLKQ